MANRERAEIELTLGGKKFLLRPTFEGLCEIEEKAGEGIPSLLFRFSKGTAGVKYLAAIVAGGTLGGGKTPLSFEEAGAAILDEGLNSVLLPCARFLASAMSKPGKAGEEGKAEEKQGA